MPNDDRRDAPKPSQSVRLREMTRTSTPATSVGDALSALTISPKLYRGIKVLKVCSNGKMVDRLLTLSRLNFILFVTPQRVPGADETSSAMRDIRQRVRKKFRLGGVTESATPRCIDIADITAVLSGFIGTRRLENSKERYASKGGFALLAGGSPSPHKVDNLNNADRIVSIVHGGDGETLDLIIREKRDREDFLDALHRIRDTYHKSKVNVGKEDLLLRYIWHDVDMDKSGRIDRKELQKVLNRLNINIQGGDVKKEYKQFVHTLHPTSPVSSARAYGRGLTYKECLAFLRRQQATTGVWDAVFGEDVERVSAEDFLTKFLHGSQREMDMKLADATNILARFNAMEIGGERGALPQGNAGSAESSTIDRIRFDEYLRSDFNQVFNPASLKFDQSTMDSPLAHYWINSSHNTYLTGDQLQSTSSVEMYVSAMQRGCKCLELDCWDGDKDDGLDEMPVVYHGYTLTSKILFADIIQSVRSYVDEHVDTYPIILSLENHCSLECQKRMASLLKETLGDRLYIPPEECDLANDLPSPEALRGMVVIKGKRPPEPDDSAENADLSKENEDEFDPYDAAAAATDEGETEGPGGRNSVEGAKVHIPKITPELAKITLFHGCKYKSFDKSISLSPSHMHSINETKVSKILDKAETNEDLWKKYNTRHFTRVYPAGSRVDSSNYSPVVPWSLGCQLVALNFQTSDSPLILNDGLFRQNGGCGYVRKPDRLFAEGQSTSPVEGVANTLRIRIISGSCLPKPKGRGTGEIVDPYVKMKLHDVKNNELKMDKQQSSVSSSSSSSSFEATSSIYHSHKTKSVSDNGFSPIWNEKWVEFRINNDAAILQFSVRDKDISSRDDTIAEAAVPVACLRPGYRSVQLYNARNNRCGPFDCSTLLIKVEYMPR